MAGAGDNEKLLDYRGLCNAVSNSWGVKLEHHQRASECQIKFARTVVANKNHQAFLPVSALPHSSRSIRLKHNKNQQKSLRRKNPVSNTFQYFLNRAAAKPGMASPRILPHGSQDPSQRWSPLLTQVGAVTPKTKHPSRRGTSKRCHKERHLQKVSFQANEVLMNNQTGKYFHTTSRISGTCWCLLKGLLGATKWFLNFFFFF